MKTWKKSLLTAGIIVSLAIPVSALACGCQGNQYRTGSGPVSLGEAQQITINYLSSIDDGSLRPGRVELNGDAYLVDIIDAGGEIVAKLNINMYNGTIQTQF